MHTSNASLESLLGSYGIPLPDPQYRVPVETVSALLDTLETYGFTRTEVIAMVKKLPPLLGYTAARTNELLTNLETYGFTRTEVIAMVKKLPPLLGYAAARTNELLALLDGVSISAMAHTRLLMLSPVVLRGRLRALAARGIAPSSALLGMSHERWGARFGQTKENIIAFGAS